MDAVEFLKKYHKLCDYRSCDDCPLLKRVDGFKTCLAGERNGYEERVVEIVEKWSKEQENKMTKAEAIELLSNDAFKLCMVQLRDPFFKECYEALNMAIEALQQEQSEDCISRADLQELFNVTTTSLMDKIDQKDIEHLVRACLMVTEMIQDAPSVVPKRGKWIEIDEYSECSCCGAESCGETPFCPYCGARMESDK